MIVTQDNYSNQNDIGGKATSLFKLQKIGFPVPPFLVIPAEVFKSTFHKINVSTKEACLALGKELNSFVLNDSTKSEVLKEIGSWGCSPSPLAVRSSMSGEDGAEHAFAGMMDSFLNVNQGEELWETIAKVAASVYSERAVDYRMHKNIDLRAYPAVIIQLQIHADAAGVIFSTSPEYPQEMAIHSVWGFGEGLVSGKLEPDEFYMLKSTGKKYRQNVPKKESAFMMNDSSGLIEIPLEETVRTKPSLSDNQCSRLFEFAQKLEKINQRPQDIEFVVENENIWIVQSRPITQPIAQLIVYDNSNIQESYCGVTTPLTFSFAQRAYFTVYRQTAYTLGISKKQIEKRKSNISKLLELVKGRIYYNINNWYLGLQLLPSFKQNKEDMERMMGLTDPVDFIEDRKKKLTEKISIFPSLLYNLIRLLMRIRSLDKDIPKFREHLSKQYRLHYKEDLGNITPQKLQKVKQRLDDEQLNNWSTPIVNDFFVMMANGKVIRHLKSLKIDNHEEFLSYLFSGDNNMENTEPVKRLLSLATIARKNTTLSALIVEGKLGFEEQISTQFSDFHKQVKQYIDIYGDRTVGELKLETVTMRVDMRIFFNYLRNYIKAEKLPDLGGENDLSLRANEELNNKLNQKGFIRRRLIKRAINNLLKAIRNREALRLDRTRLFGMYRDLYLNMGTYYCHQNVLEEKSEIFWLTEEEIWAGESSNWTTIIQKRKVEFEQYELEQVPSRVFDPSPNIHQQLEESYDTDELKGTGCYPGEVEGECIVVMGPGDNLDVSGKIVVALRTDPGWASLFPVCKAVLIEKGSSLSHSVILLRELSIPTIINIPMLTRKLTSGDQIRVNSKKGEIEILTNKTII